ncbi:MAG TPA: GxxExxY protein [Gammaproteobacteria bacterium]|nr:GxxExxY protein [Gammaproteobacteria bacterium]
MRPKRERDPQTYALIGAAMSVHSELGHGFLEAVYQEALAWELHFQSVPFRREVSLPVWYRGNQLACSYRADFLAYGNIVVELKAVPELTGKEEAQVLNYLKATGCEKGLLLNFGAPRLQYERLVW